MDNSKKNEDINSAYYSLLAHLSLEITSVDLYEIIRKHKLDMTRIIPDIGLSILHIVSQKVTNSAYLLLEDALKDALIKPEDFRLRDESGLTPLHHAVSSDNYFILEVFLNSNFDITSYINEQDSCGDTPLHIAVEYSNERLVELLIDNGASTKIRNAEGNLPIDIAMNKDDRSCLKILSEKSNMNSNQVLLYDADKLNSDLDKIKDQKSDQFTSLSNFIEANPVVKSRSCIQLPKIHELDKLSLKFPNFKEVIDYLTSELSLASFTDSMAVQFRPILMYGAPGLGKSRFIREVAKILSLDLKLIDGGSVSSSYSIAGINPSYKAAKKGAVAEFLTDSSIANGIIFVDEMDKMSASSESNQFGPLHTLLTPETSAKFKDDFLGFELNASHLNWAAAVNEINLIPNSIQDRFKLFEIPTPTKDEVNIILDSILEDIKSDQTYNWSNFIELKIPSAIREKLLSSPVRELVQTVMDAISTAAKEYVFSGQAMNGKIQLKESHFSIKKDTKNPFGFS